MYVLQTAVIGKDTIMHIGTIHMDHLQSQTCLCMWILKNEKIKGYSSERK